MLTMTIIMTIDSRVLSMGQDCTEQSLYSYSSTFYIYLFTTVM